MTMASRVLLVALLGSSAAAQVLAGFAEGASWRAVWLVVTTSTMAAGTWVAILGPNISRCFRW